MFAPRFSVVIPTRERADTLQFALRTCLEQRFDDYEIIVSDNFSSPATKAVVDAAGSPKVRYVRTAEPVAMSNNWEFGVSHARGEYLLLIGDDDGLLPHALAELDKLTRQHQPKAIRWTAAYYTWPTVAIKGQGDYLRVSLGCGLYERDGSAAIRDVATFREFYTALPMLYNAAVHRSVLDDLRRRVGRVFPHPVPDVYSGFAIAHAAGRFLSTSVPMTVSGQSHASNGIATLFNRGRNEIDREFHALNAKDGLRYEPTVPDLPVFPHVPVADTFAFAKRVLFPELPIELDRRELIAACVAGVRVSEADWPGAMTRIRESLADSPKLQEWFDRELAITPYRALPPVQLRLEGSGFANDALHLDTAAFAVTDVAGAATLCEQVLGYARAGLTLQHRTSGLGPSFSELAEKEAQIMSLFASCAQLQDQLREKDTVLCQQIREQGAQLQNQQASLAEQRNHIADLTARLNKRGFMNLLRRVVNRILPLRSSA